MQLERNVARSLHRKCLAPHWLQLPLPPPFCGGLYTRPSGLARSTWEDTSYFQFVGPGPRIGRPSEPGLVPHSNDSSVDCAGDAVQHFHVKLGPGEEGVESRGGILGTTGVPP